MELATQRNNSGTIYVYSPCKKLKYKVTNREHLFWGEKQSKMGNRNGRYKKHPLLILGPTFIGNKKLDPTEGS